MVVARVIKGDNDAKDVSGAVPGEWETELLNIDYLTQPVGSSWDNTGPSIKRNDKAAWEAERTYSLDHGEDEVA
jgi:hypothetical protein